MSENEKQSRVIGSEDEVLSFMSGTTFRTSDGEVVALNDNGRLMAVITVDDVAMLSHEGARLPFVLLWEPSEAMSFMEIFNADYNEASGVPARLPKRAL